MINVHGTLVQLFLIYFSPGTIAAKNYSAHIVTPLEDPTWLVGCMKTVFEQFPHIKNCQPAMGYTTKQLQDLEKTINNVTVDVVLNGSPIDLKRLLPNINKPVVRGNQYF